ncbi:Riboflavin transporter MCH5 [Leucoagaricus sp. SymC.cos]|nr:Riboflavin transporter MCH5 [Leucoagaricus sp. SymC.cos]
MNKSSIDTVATKTNSDEFDRCDLEKSVDVEKAPITCRLTEEELAVSTTKCCPGLLSSNANLEYPEGGLRAWGVVLGSFFIQMSTFGYMNAFGVYQDYYTRVYMTAYSASAISWIGSVSAFILLLSSLIVGRLYDHGYCMTLLYSGSFLISLSLFMLSLVKQDQYVPAFLCQGIGIGLGGGLIYVPSFGIVAQYFLRKRALTLAIVTAGVSTSSTVIPIMVNSLLQKPTLTFGDVARVNAGLITTILLIACCLIKPRSPPTRNHVNIRTSLRRFSRDWAYVILVLGNTLFGTALFFPIFFLQLAATTHGLSKTFSFYSRVILSGCGFFGRVLCGFVSRKIGVDILAIVSAAACGSITFVFIVIGSKVSIVLVGIIYGFFYGVLVAVIAPMTTSLSDNIDDIGLRLGISFAFSGLGELVGPPIMGALLADYHWW